MEPFEVIDALVSRLEKRKIDALQKELTQRMSDPASDKDALNVEKIKLREEGLGIFKQRPGAMSGTHTKASDGANGLRVA
jgi:hypothetical protein